MFCVYEHTCPNGKVYIGITCRNVKYRWNNGKGYIGNKHFYNAILKYGWENIKHEILYENLNENEAYIKEIELIEYYKSNNRKYGYNNSIGGEKSAKGCIPYNKGKHITNNGSFKKGHSVSKKTIENVIKAHKGKILSKETKRKMSIAHKNEKCFWYNKTLPNYVKIKIANAHKKKILYIEENKIFDSIKEAEKELKIHHISDCCNNKRDNINGKHFKFL